jgi:type II secretory pathway component PulC
MMKSPIVTITLIGLCSWLGWTAYEEANRPVPSIDSRVRETVAVKVKNPVKSEQKKTAIIVPPLETLGEITSRPLFNVSRRPIAVKKLAPNVKPTEINLMLSGIVIGQTGQIAHLRSATDKQTQALSVGDKIGDWQIQSIFPDRVVLRSGGRVETLYMQKPGAGNAASGRPAASRDKPMSRREKIRSQRRARRNLRRGSSRGER